MDGCILDTEGEKERVIKCLEAAIRRRVSEVSKFSFYSMGEKKTEWSFEKLTNDINP